MGGPGARNRDPKSTGRVEKACAQLAIEGKPITTDAVAALAGIGRATLYRRPELRALIEEHRQQRHVAHPLPRAWPSQSTQLRKARSRPLRRTYAGTKNNSDA